MPVLIPPRRFDINDVVQPLSAQRPKVILGFDCLPIYTDDQLFALEWVYHLYEWDTETLAGIWTNPWGWVSEDRIEPEKIK